MAKPVRVTIKGSDITGTDAPTVDDLLGQIGDFVGILSGVEKAVALDGINELVWRVTSVTMNSPINIELTPFSRNPAVNIEARAATVERATSDGFTSFRDGDPRPAYFTDEVLPNAQRMHSRVLNGLADTIVDFDKSIVANDILIDRAAAEKFQRIGAAAAAAKDVPYREMGSIEGYITQAELDGYGRAILRFRARLGGQNIKAVAIGRAFQQLEEFRLSEVWKGMRVRVHGTINYRSLGVVDNVSATGIEVLDATGLPGIKDIIDPNFTGDLTSEEFLAEVRDA